MCPSVKRVNPVLFLLQILKETQHTVCYFPLHPQAHQPTFHHHPLGMSARGKMLCTQQFLQIQYNMFKAVLF